MAASSDNFQLVFWIAVVPAFIAFGLMVFGVEEPAKHEEEGARKPPLRLKDARKLKGAFWAVVAVGSVLTLARFSEAFLVLRAQNVGFPIAFIPAIMVVMNIVYALLPIRPGCCRTGSAVMGF